MEENEAKVKIRICRICMKEYNKYSRPWGLYGARYTCSEECQKVWMKKIQKDREFKKKRTKEKLVILLIICLITGFIGAGIGGYIFSAMRMIGSPWLVILIGFAIGFFAPIFIYMEFS